MKAKKVPMRMCLGCRQMLPKKDLIRIVLPKEGELSADPTGKAHGRGAYVCHDVECLKKARKSRALERAFSTAIPPEVYDAMEAELEGHNEQE